MAGVQPRVMARENKENASPQIQASPGGVTVKNTAANKALASKSLAANNNTASPLGAKNRFGYTPSPPSEKSLVVLKSEQKVLEAAALPTAKSLIKELAQAESVDDEPAPGTKQILKDLQQNGARSSSPTNEGAECDGGFGAFTVSWTPQKVVNKPVLAAKKPTLPKVAAEKKSVPTVAVPKVPARRSMEKVAVAPKSKIAASSVVEKKAVSVKAMGAKVIHFRTSTSCIHIRHAHHTHMCTMLWYYFARKLLRRI